MFYEYLGKDGTSGNDPNMAQAKLQKYFIFFYINFPAFPYRNETSDSLIRKRTPPFPTILSAKNV